jgi:multiple sugar transport system permease protein
VLLSRGAIGIWENVGYNMVLFLAGLSAIPRELYQAAEVDGTKT